jgi:hypothetical protein
MAMHDSAVVSAMVVTRTRKPSAGDRTPPANDETFFIDYGLPIGPGGGPSCMAADQQALSQLGGGLAIPQIYNTVNPTTTDWPQPIARGYTGIQICHLCPNGPFYGSNDGEWNWYVNHGSQVPFDFNWDCPGLRCY